MRCLSARFLIGIIVSSGPTSSLGFMTTQKPVTIPTLSSLEVEKPSPVFFQPKLPISGATTSTAINAVNPELLTCLIPPAMGFLKSEWTVSYGYGFATALSALSLLLKQQQSLSITTLHAAALVFYGFRLNVFLFLRNRLSPRYRAIGETIEERSQERFPTRISRAPFVLSCGILFYGLYLPVLLTSKLASDTIAMKSAAGAGLAAMKVLIGMQWVGYVTAALGDLTKSYVKASEKNGKFLVTSGIFSILRHPNFSGEILSWTCNALCGTLSAAYLLRSKFSLSILAYLGLSTIGWLGMVFVLFRATNNLEKRQQKEYGDTEKYKEWVKTTWCGWKLSPNEAKKGEEMHEITIDAQTEEDFGSGI
jgi:steroid 5-alpha reductase family enzyme